jgi:hypothetical protein
MMKADVYKKRGQNLLLRISLAVPFRPFCKARPEATQITAKLRRYGDEVSKLKVACSGVVHIFRVGGVLK